MSEVSALCFAVMIGELGFESVGGCGRGLSDLLLPREMLSMEERSTLGVGGKYGVFKFSLFRTDVSEDGSSVELSSSSSSPCRGLTVRMVSRFVYRSTRVWNDATLFAWSRKGDRGGGGGGGGTGEAREGDSFGGDSLLGLSGGVFGFSIDGESGWNDCGSI